MQFDTTYLTEAGRSLATGTLGGLDKIQFTRAVASSHDYSATPVNDLKKLTSIEDVQQTVEYSRIIKKDDTTLTMRVDFPSKDVTTAYSLYTVGFYARPENGDEILYGVLPSSLPDYIAAYDGKSNLNDSFQTDTTVSDADNVLITVSQAGSLNEADLDAIFASKHIATIDDIKANIPATVIDGSKPADFKEAVTLEKGAVDGAGNAIATAKDLADGDAETLTSAKAYADTQASDKVKDADTAGGRNLIAQSNSVAGYMVSEGTLYADTLTSGERTSDFISVDIAKPYSLGVRVTLPANTQFWYAFSLFDKNKKFIKRMAATGPMSTDGGIDEERYWLLAPGDTRKSPLYNFTEDTAYVRVSWRSYDNAKVSFSRGLYPEDYVPAPEDKVSVSDTASWQKAKITGDDGSPKSFLYAKDNGNITMWIAGRPLGMHTFWCAAGVAGNPVSSSIQGTMSISSVKNGVGYCVSADGDFISITLVDGQVSYSVLANAANVVDRNPDTGVVSKPTDFTNLTVNGGKLVATSDDLKSLEDASWHTITGKSDSLSAYTCMYRKNNEQKYVDLVLYGTMGITVDTSDSYTELLDLSEIISAPNKAKGGIVCPLSAATGGGVSGSVSISGTKLLFSWNINNTLLYTGRPIISVGNDLNSPFLRVTFD